MAHDTPSAPSVWSVNADTIMVTADDIDDDATHLDVYVTRTLPTAGSRYLAAHVARGDLPVEITDLDLGIPQARFSVVVRAWSVGDESGDSAETLITMPRLYVFGHVDRSAVGVKSVQVDVGYPPDQGRLFPAELIAIPQVLRDFDVVAVTYQGPAMPVAEQMARMVVQVDTMPTPKIRNGDRMTMVCQKDLGGGKARWTPIFNDALVREDAPTWGGLPGDYGSRYFGHEFFDPTYYTDGYFG
jgi:hypothetical protein